MKRFSSTSSLKARASVTTIKGRLDLTARNYLHLTRPTTSRSTGDIISRTSRSDSGPHNTSIISQELNISYNSVFDSRLARYKIPLFRDRSSEDLESEGESQQEDNPTLGVVDAITKSMNALDVESRSYFEEKNAKENERIKMLRRSYTPDPYLTQSVQSVQGVQSPVTVSGVSPALGGPGDSQNSEDPRPLPWLVCPPWT